MFFGKHLDFVFFVLYIIEFYNFKHVIFLHVFYEVFNGKEGYETHFLL